MKCDVIAQGVINAAKQLNLSLPVIVRLQVFFPPFPLNTVFIAVSFCREQGTNVEQANKLLAGDVSVIIVLFPSNRCLRLVFFFFSFLSLTVSLIATSHHTIREWLEAFARQGLR